MTVAIRRHLLLAFLIAVLLLLLFGTLLRGQERPSPPPPIPTAEVTSVRPYGPADRAGLQVGDHVLAVDGTRVLSPSELRRLLYDAGHCAKLMVRRGRTGPEFIIEVFPEGGRIGIDARMIEGEESY